MIFDIDDAVHVDSDTEQWGRVCGEGIILSLFDDSALVEFSHINGGSGGCITIPMEDMRKV